MWIRLESSGVVCQKVSDHLGLSEYESRVYVSLVEDGISEAGKLSMSCGVPRTKVYITLKKLAERDLIFEIPGSPRRFAPSPPSEAFKQYLAKIKENVSDRVISLIVSKKVIASLEEAYRRAQSGGDPQKEELWIVEGRDEILRKIREMLSHAKRTVNVVAKEDEFIWFSKTFGKMLDRLVEADVEVQIETKINSHNGNLAKELGYIYKIRSVDANPPLLYLCTDEETFFVAKLSLMNLELESEKSSGIFSKGSVLYELLSPLLRPIG